MQNKKRIIPLICIIVFLIASCLIVFSSAQRSVQTKKIDAMNSSLLNYFYISCPNGNALRIEKHSKFNVSYRYYLDKYHFDLYADDGHSIYGSDTDIKGNTIFYHAEILSGSKEVNHETDFPKCVIKINDALSDQLFFYPGYSESDIDTKPSTSGKLYVSFREAISYEKALEVVENMTSYGTVTWLWVDTYRKTDMSNAPITLQNPLNGGELPVYGIPLYYNGQDINAPSDAFLNILNNAPSDDNANDIDRMINDIKSGINDSETTLTEKDLRIIGLVLLPTKDIDRTQIIEEICNKGKYICR